MKIEDEFLLVASAAKAKEAKASEETRKDGSGFFREAIQILDETDRKCSKEKSESKRYEIIAQDMRRVNKLLDTYETTRKETQNEDSKSKSSIRVRVDGMDARSDGDNIRDIHAV